MSGRESQSDGEGLDRPASQDASGDGTRELVLVKKGQRFVFRCAPGGEAQLLERLRDLVEDPDVDLSWFDAAVLSHQVGEQLGRRLNEIRGMGGR